jgi:hypothetical protein
MLVHPHTCTRTHTTHTSSSAPTRTHLQNITCGGCSFGGPASFPQTGCSACDFQGKQGWNCSAPLPLPASLPNCSRTCCNNVTERCRSAAPPNADNTTLQLVGKCVSGATIDDSCTATFSFNCSEGYSMLHGINGTEEVSISDAASAGSDACSRTSLPSVRCIKGE